MNTREASKLHALEILKSRGKVREYTKEQLEYIMSYDGPIVAGDHKDVHK